MYENSGRFRDSVDLKRYAVNPTMTFTPGSSTKIMVGYEHVHDRRVADRGIPSFLGRPVDTDASTYFGNPRDAFARAGVNLGSVAIEHQAGRLNMRNRCSCI